MTSAKNDALVRPSARFVTDFTRLITDIDRLMLDIGGEIGKPVSTKPNGHARTLTFTGAISALREHAHSFLKSLRHSQLLLDYIPVPFLQLDGKARIVKTNHECEKLLNSNGSLLRGKSLFNVVAASDVTRLRQRLAMARQTDKPFVVPLSIVNNNKGYPVELHIRREFAGGQLGYLAVVGSAIRTEPTNGARAPRRHEGPPLITDLVVNLSRAQTLHSMAEAVGNHCRKAFRSPAGMIFVERNGELQLAFDWYSPHIAKNPPVDLLTKHGPVAQTFRTGRPIFFTPEGAPRSTISRFMFRLLRRCRCRSAAFLPISSPSQRPMGVLTMALPQERLSPAASDYLLRLGQVVSGWVERARAYDEAVAARDRIESAMQSKDEFLSMLSHELRNPMMPILGWAVALSSGPLSAEKQNLALEGIIRNVRALNYLIEDLFDAVRISSGKLRLQPSTIRIQDVAREALAAVQANIENKKLRVSTDISEAIPPFFADSRRLLQVLMNLLNNAVKFTPAGGLVALRIRRRSNAVECLVSDNGRGIERKFLPFVFDRLRQGTRSWKGPAAGLGLGLAIVREIVELHGGSIQAFSDGPDRGSAFVFRLPLRKKPNGRTAKAPAKPDSALRKNISVLTE